MRKFHSEYKVKSKLGSHFSFYLKNKREKQSKLSFPGSLLQIPAWTRVPKLRAKNLIQVSY